MSSKRLGGLPSQEEEEAYWLIVEVRAPKNCEVGEDIEVRLAGGGSVRVVSPVHGSGKFRVLVDTREIGELHDPPDEAQLLKRELEEDSDDQDEVESTVVPLRRVLAEDSRMPYLLDEAGAQEKFDEMRLIFLYLECQAHKYTMDLAAHERIVFETYVAEHSPKCILTTKTARSPLLTACENMRRRHANKWRPALDALTELQEAAEVRIKQAFKYETEFAHSENYAKILRDAANKFHEVYKNEIEENVAMVENHLFDKEVCHDKELKKHLIAFLAARKDTPSLLSLRWWLKLRRRILPLCDHILQLLTENKFNTEQLCARQLRAELRGAAHKLRLRPAKGIEQKHLEALTALLRREKKAFDFGTAIKHYSQTFAQVSSALEMSLKQNAWSNFCNSLFYGEYCVLKYDALTSPRAKIDIACKRAVELSAALPWNPLFLYSPEDDSLEHIATPFGPESLSSSFETTAPALNDERLVLCVDSSYYFEGDEDFAEDDLASTASGRSVFKSNTFHDVVDGEVSPSFTTTTNTTDNSEEKQSYLLVLSDDGQELRRLTMLPSERLASAVLTAAPSSELPELIAHLLCDTAVKVVDARHAKKIALIADSLPWSHRRRTGICRFGLKPEPDGSFIFAPIVPHSTLLAPESLWRSGEVLAPHLPSRKLSRRAKAAKIKALKALDGVAGDTEYRKPLVHRDAYSDDDQDFEMFLGEQDPVYSQTPAISKHYLAERMPQVDECYENNQVYQTDDTSWDQVCKRLARKQSFSSTGLSLSSNPNDPHPLDSMDTTKGDTTQTDSIPIISALDKFLDDVFYLPLRRFAHKHDDPTVRVAVFRLDDYIRATAAPPLFHARIIASTRFADALLDHTFGTSIQDNTQAGSYSHQSSTRGSATDFSSSLLSGYVYDEDSSFATISAPEDPPPVSTPLPSTSENMS